MKLCSIAMLAACLLPATVVSPPIVPVTSEDSVQILNSSHIGQEIFAWGNSTAEFYFEDWTDADYNDLYGRALFGNVIDGWLSVTVEWLGGLSAFTNTLVVFPDEGASVRLDNTRSSHSFQTRAGVPLTVGMISDHGRIDQITASAYKLSGTSDVWASQRDNLTQATTPEPSALILVGTVLTVSIAISIWRSR